MRRYWFEFRKLEWGRIVDEWHAWFPMFAFVLVFGPVPKPTLPFLQYRYLSHSPHLSPILWDTRFHRLKAYLNLSSNLGPKYFALLGATAKERTFSITLTKADYRIQAIGLQYPWHWLGTRVFGKENKKSNQLSTLEIAWYDNTSAVDNLAF